MYACDKKWWDAHHTEVAAGFRGECWTQDEQASATYGLRYIESVNDAGLCRRPGRIYTGGNSGYQAVGLAYHLGAARIVLLGYDMQKTDGKDHWHGSHPDKMGNPHPSSLNVWAARFGVLATDLREAGVQIHNMSRQTAIRGIDRITLDEFLNGETTHHC